jgi:hypothetical protein
MTDYRAYIIGIDGHRFVKATGFLNDYPNDAIALKAAEQLVNGHDVELWDCARLVARMSQTSSANAACDEKTKACGAAAGLRNLGVEAAPVDKSAALQFNIEGSSAPNPVPQAAPNSGHQQASSASKRSGGWRAGRKTVVAIAKLFRRKVG